MNSDRKIGQKLKIPPLYIDPAIIKPPNPLSRGLGHVPKFAKVFLLLFLQKKKTLSYAALAILNASAIFCAAG
jgi:hypothetical protein